MPFWYAYQNISDENYKSLHVLIGDRQKKSRPKAAKYCGVRFRLVPCRFAPSLVFDGNDVLQRIGYGAGGMLGNLLAMGFRCQGIFRGAHDQAAFFKARWASSAVSATRNTS